MNTNNGNGQYDQYPGYYEMLNRARELIAEFLEAPDGRKFTPDYFMSALFYMDSLPKHTCYWNERFFIAVTFKLPAIIQRQAAWCAVSNGLNGYWQWNTWKNGGYADMDVFLGKLGIKINKSKKSISNGNGKLSACCKLSLPIARQIVEIYDLPTRIDKGGKKEKFRLSRGQRTERNCFNRVYPATPVL